MTAIYNVMSYPKYITVIKDCYWSHNQDKVANNLMEEWLIRTEAKMRGWHLVDTPVSRIPMKNVKRA